MLLNHIFLKKLLSIIMANIFLLIRQILIDLFPEQHLKIWISRLLLKLQMDDFFNYASQVWNHIFYFECLQPGSKNSIRSFGIPDQKRFWHHLMFFKNAFAKAAGSLFGAGWIWLVLTQDGSIQIMVKSNAGNPLRIGLIPLMTCDLWEHAYYLDYQNRCNDYLNAFWKLINWDVVESRYNHAILS